MTHSRRHCRNLLTLSATFLISSSADAQLLKRSFVIRNATIHTMNGSVIERGSILIKGDRIAAVGEKVDAPLLATTVDAAGMTVTPGLIDPYSALGRLDESQSVMTTSRAVDAFDSYGRVYFREALRRGVTTVYVGPAGQAGVGGMGAVFQLKPTVHDAAGHVLDEESALAVDLGSEENAIARAKAFQKIRKAFRTALEYRQSLEDYEEDLKEYLEKLEERRKKKEEEKDKSESKQSDGEEKVPGEDKPEEDKNGEDEEKDDPEPSPESSASTNDGAGSLRTVPDDRRSAAPQGLNDDGDNSEDKEKPSDEKEDGASKEKKKDDDELEKPQKPKPDRVSEVLLRAIDREIPVRINAHRSADIFNALELADEFHLDCILEGATDAHLIADRIAKADVPVVLGPPRRPHLFEDNEYRRHSDNTAAILRDAGALWTVGSGAENWLATRFVGLNAQLASQKFDDSTAWLHAVTTQAARVLGLQEKIGRIKPGYLADVVIWDGAPGDPATEVFRVFVSGSVVYSAPKAK